MLIHSPNLYFMINNRCINIAKITIHFVVKPTINNNAFYIMHKLITLKEHIKSFEIILKK